MKRLFLAIALLTAAGALADAYRYLPFRMTNTASNPFPYYQDNRSATPAGLDVGLVRTQVETAWGKWNGVACAMPKTVSRGFTTGSVTNPQDLYDVFNVTPVWLSTRDQTYYDVAGPYVLGISVPIAYAGVLNSCDTFLNAVDFQWSVAAQTPTDHVDVQSVVLHEFGHCLGLDHNGGSTDVMERSIEVGESFRDLGTNDTQSLCERNPTSGAQFSPCSADGGCGGTPGLKCVSQQIGTQTNRFCSAGCTVNAGSPDCAVPLSCQLSSQFAGFNGACLLPSGAITPVGKACTGQPDCESPQSLCIAPSGTSWANGYCTQSCESGRGPCPVGSACTQFSDGTVQCMKSCRVGLADCRSEYACQQTTNGGVCIPRCYIDSDCGSADFLCRTCDGLCVPKQTPTAQIGSICTTDAQCGPGQSCLGLDQRSPTKVCTEQCGRGCAACKPGSSCHAFSDGSLYCLRDCTGPGTCPTGLQCSDVSGGKGCMPPCAQNTGCPVGLTCMTTGQCQVPENMMCGSLCGANDSGMIINPVIKDAGSGGGPGLGGCGCVSADGSAMWLLLAGVVLVASRKMKWLQL